MIACHQSTKLASLLGILTFYVVIWHVTGGPGLPNPCNSGRNQHHTFGFFGRGPLCTIMVHWYNNLAGPKRYIRALGCALWWGNEHWMTIFPSKWRENDMSFINASEFYRIFAFFSFFSISRHDQKIWKTFSWWNDSTSRFTCCSCSFLGVKSLMLLGMTWRREEFHGSFLKIASVTSRETKMVVFDPGPEGSRPSAVGGVLFGDCQWFQAFFGV